MILLALLVGSAWAEPDVEEPPTCAAQTLESLPPAADRLAVAWVAPWRRRPRGRIAVVPIQELKGWLSEQDPWWTGRTLQYLGLRRRGSDPRRRFQVRVLEVTRDELCRPLDGVERGTDVRGVQACRRGDLGPARRSDGCGRTLDRRTGKPGATRYVVDLGKVDKRGFCVVPLTRYLEEVTER